MSINRVFRSLTLRGDPPLTKVEVTELAQIHPDGREVFYKRVKREWYAQIIISTVLLYSIEYMVFSFDALWVYFIPIIPVFSLAHRLKFNRSTNYGALAAAKLNQPRSWPSWKRNTDTKQERRKIEEEVNTSYGSE